MIYEHGEPGSTEAASFITSYEEACGVCERAANAFTQLEAWARQHAPDMVEQIVRGQRMASAVRIRIILSHMELPTGRAND